MGLQFEDLQRLVGGKLDDGYGLKPNLQCWTEGRSSTAVAEDFRPTATATVAEVLGNFHGRRKFLN